MTVVDIKSKHNAKKLGQPNSDFLQKAFTKS